MKDISNKGHKYLIPHDCAATFCWMNEYLQSWQCIPETPKGHAHLKGAIQDPPFKHSGWQNAIINSKFTKLNVNNC